MRRKLAWVLQYPVRRIQFILEDFFYVNAKLVIGEDEDIDKEYFEWLERVEKWKKGEIHYKQVESQAEILSTIVQTEINTTPNSEKTENLKQAFGGKIYG